jgi:hypothetical protein
MSCPCLAIVRSNQHPYPPMITKSEGAMLKRMPHGGTARPPLARPGSGYGRRPGRPQPTVAVAGVARRYRDWWSKATDLAAAAATVPEPIERAHRQPA